MGELTIKGGQRLNAAGAMVLNDEIQVAWDSDVKEQVTLSDNDLIVSGLVDVHCHLRAHQEDSGVNPIEACALNGVLAAADAGTFGIDEWGFADQVWRHSSLFIRSWVFLLPQGLHGPKDLVSVDRLIEPISKATQSGRALGIKVRLGQGEAEYDRALLGLARDLRSQMGCRFLIHLTDTALDLREVAESMEPGDVLSHVLHGRQGRVVLNGKPHPALIELREKGVILDCAHGGNHFSWDTLDVLAEAGIWPDTISTDLTVKTWDKRPVYHLPHVLSKLISAGMPVASALLAASYRPGKILGFAPSWEKNVVVLKKVSGPIDYFDFQGQARRGSAQYVPHVVVNRGRWIRGRTKV